MSGAFTYSRPPGRKGLVTSAHTFVDFPHDPWGTLLPRVLLIGSCDFLHFHTMPLPSLVSQTNYRLLPARSARVGKGSSLRD